MRCSSPQPETPNSKSETKKDSNDYYENGNIRIERKRLENGDSLWIFKQEDGGCWEENFYRDGEIYKKIVYNSDCTKSAEYELKNGKRHGEWKSYHENGKLREYGIYQEGIPKGIFEYYDEKGLINSKENNFIIDFKINSFFSFENNLKIFKSKLKSLEGYYEDENIEVAGNKKYHFPEIYWKNSVLYFDLSDSEGPTKCVAGKIKDDDIPLFGGVIIPGKSRFFEIKFLGLMPGNEINYVHLYDLKENIQYSFKIGDEIIKEVEFKVINYKN
jgi:antitoxin component YwqK of YwqJK toxin-antitoxin module